MMTREPIAYLNGEWIPFSAAKLSVADYGIVQAATVTEMLRTFRHQPFRVSEHLERMRRSLQKTGIAAPDLVDDLPAIIQHVVEENSKSLPSFEELGVSVFITAGIHPSYARGSNLNTGSPTICVHSFLLPTERWNKLYEHGVHLVTGSVRAVPRTSVDPQIKTRNRLHWFLADQAARDSGPPHAMAVLLDADDHLTETSSGNLIVYDGQVLLTPRPECVLEGISQGVVLEIANSFGIPHRAEDLTIAELQNAREAFVSSTSYCLLPVTRANGKIVGSGQPGPLFHRIIEAWSQMVGGGIIRQTQKPQRMADA